MADVTARVGVSVSTVSQVVSGTLPVDEAMLTTAHQTIELSGNLLNAVARLFATSRTKLLGVVISATSNPFYDPMFSVLEEAARRRRFNRLLADSHEQPKHEQEQVQVHLNQQIAGLVLARAMRVQRSSLMCSTPGACPPSSSTDLPTTVSTRSGPRTSLRPPSWMVMSMTGVTAASPSSPVDDRSRWRRSAWRATGQDWRPLDCPLRLRWPAAGRSLSAPARATQRLPRLAETPTPIVSGNNEMTLGMLREIRDVGLSVPHNVTAAAFGDMKSDDLIEPGMTVRSQDAKTIGHSGIGPLLQRIKGGHRRPAHRRIAPTFVHRSSCGCGCTTQPQERAAAPAALA